MMTASAAWSAAAPVSTTRSIFGQVRRSLDHRALRHLDLLELRLDLGTAVLEPWRPQQLFAEGLLLLVHPKTDVPGRDLAQDAPPRAATDRAGIIAVLYLPDVGVAQRFAMRL